MKVLALNMCVWGMANVAWGAITSIDITPVPQTLLPGFQVYDISITGTGIWTGSQMLLTLDQGTMYQSLLYQSRFPFSTYLPPADFVSIFPESAFDTFVAIGSRTSPGSFVGLAQLLGGALNLGGSGGEGTFNTSRLDIAWWSGGGNIVRDPQDYFVAWVTVSNDAHGTLKLLANSFIEPTHFSPPISFTDGEIGYKPTGSLPEGSSIVLDGALRTEFLAKAVELARYGTTPFAITGFSLSGDPYFTAATNPQNPLAVDLGLTGHFRSLPAGTTITSTLTIHTNGVNGDITYNLVATVPEPSTAMLAGLGLAVAGCLWRCRLA